MRLVNSASFSPDGTRIVTACEDNTARVWDAATGKPLGESMRQELIGCEEGSRHHRYYSSARGSMDRVQTPQQ